MKKFITVLSIALLFLCMPAALQAQLTLRPQLGLGLASQTIRINGEPIQDEFLRVRSTLAVEAGATLAYPLTNQVSLYSGLLLHNRGVRLVTQQDFNDGSIRVAARATTIHAVIPIGASVLLPTRRDIWVDAGLNIGVGLLGWAAVSRRVRYRNERDSETVRDWMPYGRRDSDRRADIRLVLGGRTSLGDDATEVGFRLSLGLSDVDRSRGGARRNNAFTVFLARSLEILD